MRLTIFFTILIFYSCERQKSDLVEYKDGRQLLSVNETDRKGNKINLPKVGVDLPEKITVGNELTVKVFLKERKDFSLIDAYYDCATVENASVDTVPNPANKMKRLSGCKMGLINQNDTIYITLIPQKMGKATFNEITLLTRDKEKIYRTQKFTFEYTVDEK